jgi:8-oxo-dGTP diphosphatase
MRTIERTIVSALIFSKDGKLLMGMKDPNGGGVYADCWHIPGGGVEDGETLEQALRREILEEVGLDISKANVSLADDKGRGQTEKTLKDTNEKVLCNMAFNVFRVDVGEDATAVVARPSDDLVKLEWVNLSNLNDYKLTPPWSALFKRLRIIP